MNRYPRALLTLLFALTAFALAFGLRAYAANTLTIDYDEDDYLRAAQEFAQLLRAGDWIGFTETNYRPEHPQLAKFMFGLRIAGLPEAPLIADLPITAEPAEALPPDLLLAARNLSAVWGSLTAALLALVNPLGGLLLATHSFTVKYTSQVMLDGFASLMSACAGLAYFASGRGKGRAQAGFLAASAVFLGLSASSKYLHSAVGIAILVDWFLSARGSGRIRKFLPSALAWGILALAAFFLFNPYYWPAPLERLRLTFEAVTITTTNPNVERANLPLWQPLVHLASSVPVFWNEAGIPVRADGLIFVFALFGFFETWRKNRFFAVWLLVDLLLLLAWRTKWAQYILVATVPLSFVAAEGVKTSGRNLSEWWRARGQRRDAKYRPSFREARRAFPWLLPGVSFFIALTLLPIAFQFTVSMTTLDRSSLVDGLQGGIAREVWGGLSGEIEVPTDQAALDERRVHFSGLKAYQEALDFLNGVGMIFFGFFWTVLSVSLQAALGVGAGYLLWRSRSRARKLWQLIFILPWAIPEAVGALLWLNVFAPFNGWLALAVRAHGSDIPFGNLTGWERDPETVLVVLLIAALWYGFPFIMLAAGAGFKMIPRESLDAAAIDGASPWQAFRYVTWPLLQPLVLPAVLVRAILAFNQFYLFQMILPIYGNISMLTLSSFSYYVLYRESEFSFSAAINILSLALLSGFVVLLTRRGRAVEGATYA
jgi:ABC-type sugar transport system permease subunit